jgi:hypothetical protein
MSAVRHEGGLSAFYSLGVVGDDRGETMGHALFCEGIFFPILPAARN